MDFHASHFSQKKLIFYFIIVLVLFRLAYGLFLSAPGSFPKGNIITVEEGTGLRGVSLKLKNENIIRSRTIFEMFVIINGGEKHLIPTDYLFEKKLPVYEVARRISKGESHLAPLKVTIPEGFDVAEIAEVFDLKLPKFDKDKFLAQAKEGYLFPDTYFFLSTSTEENVLKAMRDNYEKKVAPLRKEITASGKSEKDVLVMASIIEREAKGEEDREFISGILWKRISIGIALGVDAAPDTYRTKGLPKEPICSAGVAAIKAAIHPKSSAYLYYLHDKDGTIHYARNFEEHKANKAKYLNN